MIEAPLVLGAGCGGVFTFLSAYFSLSLFPFWRAYGDVMPLSTGNRSEKKGGEGGGGDGQEKNGRCLILRILFFYGRYT